MQSGHRKTPVKSSPLPIFFNINTYKFHMLWDYTQVIKTFGMMDSYSTQIVSILSLLICKPELKHAKGEWAHQLIKHMYGSSNKKVVKAQFSRQERWHTILQQQNNLSLDSEEMDNKNNSPLIHHFMTGKARQDNIFSLPQLLCENHGDPALKVCYVKAPFTPCLISLAHSSGGFHTTTEGPPVVQVARIGLQWWWAQLHCPAAKCHPIHQYRHSHPVQGISHQLHCYDIHWDHNTIIIAHGDIIMVALRDDKHLFWYAWVLRSFHLKISYHQDGLKILAWLWWFHLGIKPINRL